MSNVMYTIEAYNPQGFLVGLASDDYMELMKAISQHKLTPAAPEAAEDMPKMFTHRIVTVIRRQQLNRDNTMTDVIDCYPRWSKKMGAKRVAHFYLNTPQDRDTFQARAGVEVDAMPIYGGQVALQRKESTQYPYEVECTPFYISKTQTGVNDEGNPIYDYKYVDGPGNSAEQHNGPALPAGKPAWITEFDALCKRHLAMEGGIVFENLQSANLIAQDKVIEDMGREVVYAAVRQWVSQDEILIDVDAVKVAIQKEKRTIWADCGFFKAVSYTRQPFRSAGVPMSGDWAAAGDYPLVPPAAVTVKFSNNQYVIVSVEWNETSY